MSLKVTDVRSGYGRAIFLQDVSVEIAPGEVVALLGANGAGKSTLARTIAGTLHCRAGRIEVDGERVDRWPADRRACRGLTLVPEGRRLFASLTVGENIALGRIAAARRPPETDHVTEVLDAFPVLRERWNQQAGLLSGGEQQMVALTRAVAANPRFLLLDEPSLGLSPLLVTEVYRLIRHIVERTRAGVLLVEQMTDLALEFAARAYVLDRGRVVLSGSSEIVAASPQVRSAYLGES